MNFLLKASVLVVLLFNLGLAKAEESKTPETTKETALPSLPVEQQHPITLDEAIKKVLENSKNKVLAAKTTVVDNKKLHVIKVLTSSGHIQHISFDAATGKILDKIKK